MAPDTSVVDLTISDDEGLPTTRAKPRASAHSASSTGRKSGSNYVKATPARANGSNTPKPRNGVTAYIDLSSGPSSKQNSTKPKIGTTIKEQREHHMKVLDALAQVEAMSPSHNSQDPPNQKSGEPDTSSSNALKKFQEGARKSSFIPVVINDDSREATPVFKSPRGYDTASSQNPSSSKPVLGSPFDHLAAGPRKRPFESDGVFDQKFGFKKQKTDTRSDGPKSVFDRQSSQIDSPRRRTNAKFEAAIAKQRPRETSNTSSAAPETINLVSPTRTAQKSPALRGEDGIAKVPKKKQGASPLATAGNGTLNSASRPGGEDKDNRPTEGSAKPPENLPSSQSKLSNGFSLHQDPPLADRVSIALKDDEEPSEANAEIELPRFSDFADDAPQLSSPRQRKQTEKAKSLGMNKQSEPHSKPETRTPSITNKTPARSRVNGHDKGQPSPRKDAEKLSSAPDKVLQQNGFHSTPAPQYSTGKTFGNGNGVKTPVSSSDGDRSQADKMGSTQAATQTAATQTNGFSFDSRASGTPAVRNAGAGGNAGASTPSDFRHSQVDSNDKLKAPEKHAGPRYSPLREDPCNNSLKAAGTPQVLQEDSDVAQKQEDATRRHGLQQPNKLRHTLEQPTVETAHSSKANKDPEKRNATVAEEADLQLRTEAMKGLEASSPRKAEKNASIPIPAPTTMNPPSIYPELPLANQVERVLGKYLGELREDNEYWTSVSMQRARLAKEEQQSEVFPGAFPVKEEERTSFANLKPIKFSPQQKGSSSTKSQQVWAIEKFGSTGHGKGVVNLSASYTTFKSDTPDVPSYSHYVSIKNNILAPNVTNLHCWPYFGDNFEGDEQNLHEQYNIDIGARERKLRQLLQAQKHEEYVESALQDLGCSWEDVLRFLLELKPVVGNDLDARRALANRTKFCEEDFSRTSARSKAILAALPSSGPERLARVAVLCETFQKMADFSIWHVARRSDAAKSPERSPETRSADPADNELTCRICLRFNCPYHGELHEHPDDGSDVESDFAVDSVVATDIVHPTKVNYRTRVAFPPSFQGRAESTEQSSGKAGRKDPKYWHTPGLYREADERGPFYPCHHPGATCEDAGCSCWEAKVPCEKICSCPPDCKRKFQGCDCVKRGHRVCFNDAECACFFNGRECDPDLCGSCGACEVVDPVNKYEDSVSTSRCRNCSIQRGVPKQTLLGDSGVHGLGLYACEDIREHDFVGEYKGEIITKEEAERRGAVYEHQKLSYLFSLNATQEIDSTYFGNKVRFINHASGYKANLYPRIIMVNTVHRIALYANSSIRAGQELLFDYGPKFPDEQLGGKKSKKSAPHVRNANLVKGFLDVEKSRDEVGNLRAKGIDQATAVKTKKPRGGARPGAGRKPHALRESDETNRSDEYTEQDAGERLAAFNISDDGPSDQMELDEDADVGADDVYTESEGYESDGSGESEESEVDLSDEDEDEGLGRPDRRLNGVSTRRSRR
ncbi:hypothetical protein LTR37_004354 [Vermiconidia calcicola]|uniref:Uncharacterized protein n=1 Tax=Vermiconidia calcicola TaxID=1690605 RepID=A0ACC3NM53_9PEZI|nr:hypothetical protein LTR37_004354 [Vermiconidia calcicola]